MADRTPTRQRKTYCQNYKTIQKYNHKNLDVYVSTFWLLTFLPTVLLPILVRIFSKFRRLGRQSCW